MTNGQKTISLPTISAVEAYLLSKGWSRITPPDPARANPNVRVYRGASDVDGNPLTAALPARPDLIDARQRVREVVRMLAALEAKSPLQMIQTITSQAPAARAAARPRGKAGQMQVLQTKDSANTSA